MISNISKKILFASKLRGVGRKTLEQLASDRLFYETPIEEFSEYFDELKNFKVDSTAYSNALNYCSAQIDQADKFNDHIVSICDAAYPPLLRLTPDRPVLLYVRGNLASLSERSVAIVGTREPTAHGEVVAERITSHFSQRLWVVVSGLAIGIDSIAHKTCVDSSRKTIAVLAHGVDSIYPKRNAGLAQQIIEGGGALVSEYGYGTPGFPSNFVERDRIQAGLAAGVIMVQSDRSGGSWHASRAALRYKRLLAVPETTSADKQMMQAKARGNRFVFESDSLDVADFLSCTVNDLNGLLLLKSKLDYENLEERLSAVCLAPAMK